MKITLIFTGKTSETYLRDGIDIYTHRLKRYFPCEIIITGEYGKKKGSSVKRKKDRELEKLIKALNSHAYIILLDEKGEKFKSGEFAKFIDRTITGGYREIVFVTGGPYGFPDELYNKANQVISLSDMTFSHQMVRLILVEQLYRAMTIIRGEPYHH